MFKTTTIKTMIMSLMLVSFAFADVFITEIADPNNNADARYIELYNNGDTDVDLNTGWALQRWTNGDTDPQSPVALTGSISAGGFYVICNDAEKFETTYGFAANQDIGTGGAADSNGDDNIAILDATGTIVDMFGVAGEDGTGTSHEFEDGRAERIGTVTAANPVWNVAEWNIDNDSGGGDGPQDAPGGFDPASWIGATSGGNSAPIVNAGSDVEIMANETGTASVTLDGSGTYDLEGDAMTYSWVLSGTEVSTDVSFTTDLAVGVHTFTLTVNDGELDGTDDVIITVTAFLNAYAVTFNIDMSLETVSDDGVRISGLSDDMIAMTDEDADGIYTATVDLFEGDHTYNFRNGWGYESGDNLADCAGGDYGNDRSVTVVDADIILGTVCWESCEDCPVDIYGCMDDTAVNYDPNATIDDGSCLSYPAIISEGVVVINEIHYNPSSDQGDDDNFEFLELYNTSDADVDLSFALFTEGIDHVFEYGTTISAGGYLVLAKDSSSYSGSIEWENGSLSNGGEDILLANGVDSSTIDFVDYDDGGDWPSSPDGDGPSLELIDTSLDNALPESWQASYVDNGTPGAENSEPVNQAPTADAGADISAMVDETTGLATVTLDGSGSTDPDGDALTYSWTLDGTEVSMEASFTADLTVGVFTYTLTVNDGEFDATDDVVVTITEYVEPLTPLLSEDFEAGEGDFTSFSVTSDKDWYHSSYGGNSFMKINGYEGDEFSDDWLYTPVLNFDLFTDEVLNFGTMAYYDGPDLQVKISTDFIGGDPSAATWTDLSGFTLSEGSYTYVESGNIDVSEFGGTAVTIAFRYLSDETGSTTWEIDDVFVGGYPADVMAETPAITPAGGLYFDPVDVSITCGTPGSAIYYTLDGTDPSDVSTLYDGVFTVSEDITVKAIAYADGYLTSLVTSETYSFPTVATIYEIQGQVEDSPYAGQIVETSGIITATGGSKHFVQDGVGAWNGLYIYDGDNTYAVGDHVTLVGEVTEYYNLTEIMNIESLTVNSSGNDLPASAVLTTGEVNAEAYEGVLVSTTGLCDTEVNDYGEWSVDDGSGSVIMDDIYFEFTPTLGEEYAIKGPVTYGYGNFKILPRTESDIIHVEVVPEFTFTVNVAGTSDDHDVTVGFSRDATDGYDAEIDQYAPPAPPPPAFDAALSWESDRYYTQILNGAVEDWTVEHVYDIQLQFDESNTITLTWDNAGLNELGTFILQDAFGGVFVDVVMNSTTSLTLDDPMITMLKFRVTPGEFIEPVPVPGFVCSLNVAGEGSDSDLTFGFSPDATDGYDVGLDLYHPPPPPPPAFDASLSWGGDRYFTQILNGAVEDWEVEHVYDIQLQFDESNTITLTWDNTLWPYYGSFILQDAFGGALINVDMNQETSLVLDDPAFNLLKLKIVPGGYTPPPTYDIVLNEFLASSENCCGPEDSDFVELYNFGTEEINISGWGFSDENGVVATTVPEGTVVPAGGYIVAWYTGDADGWPEVDSKLSAGGETIYVEDAEGYTVILHNYDDSFDYDDISANLTEDGTYVTSVIPTPGEENIIDPLVLGCTDDEALNYNDDANYDDGSCEYPAAPQNLVAEADTASVLLTWDPADMGEENDGFDFSVSIDVDGDSDVAYTLTAGFSPEATDGYDEGMDMYAPPAPPPPAFDAAIGWLSDRYYTQLLNGADGDASEHVFDIQLQFDTNNIINLSWDNTGLAALGTFILQDAFGGAMINIDMTEESTYTVDNPAFNLLKLKITPAVYNPTYSVYRDGILHAEGVVETTYLDTTGLNESIEHCYTVTQVLPGGIESAHSEEVCATPIWLALDDQLVPNVFALHQNYPNPFNPITTIVYDIAEESSVRLSVYNLMGQRVRTLVSAHQTPGRYQVQWNSTNDHGEALPSGLYIYKIDATGFTDVKKLVLMK